jgi:uncharacterized protein (DUF58 family)
VQTPLFPTEGSFRLRAYAPGDDARRIHWPRSLKAQQLIVRLPDERPQVTPSLRLVLDTHLEDTAGLATPAADELCDALVRVWLSLGHALMLRDRRVTMVAADGRMVEQPMTAQTRSALLHLGARVSWQSQLPLEAMLRSGAEQIVVSARPRPSGDGVQFVVLPRVAWTEPEPIAAYSPALLPYPSGARENRWLLRRRAARAQAVVRCANERLNQLCDFTNADGALIACRRGGRVALRSLP